LGLTGLTESHLHPDKSHYPARKLNLSGDVSNLSAQKEEKQQLWWFQSISKPSLWIG
jgi:hypothetical protein